MLGYCHISHWCLCRMRRQVSLCEGPKLILFARILLARWVGITYTWGHLLPLSSLGDSRTSQFSSGNLYHWNPTNVWVPITYSGPSLHRSTTSWRHGSMGPVPPQHSRVVWFSRGKSPHLLPPRPHNLRTTRFQTNFYTPSVQRTHVPSTVQGGELPKHHWPWYERLKVSWEDEKKEGGHGDAE